MNIAPLSFPVLGLLAAMRNVGLWLFNKLEKQVARFSQEANARPERVTYRIYPRDDDSDLTDIEVTSGPLKGERTTVANLAPSVAYYTVLKGKLRENATVK